MYVLIPCIGQQKRKGEQKYIAPTEAAELAEPAEMFAIVGANEVDERIICVHCRVVNLRSGKLSSKQPSE